MLQKWATYFLYFLTYQKFISAIVNLHQETANPIFYKRIPPARSSRAWQDGVNCIDEVAEFYFIKRETLTRSYNLVVAISTNMTTPAAEIQDGYIELLNEIVSSATEHRFFQLRIISDAEFYNSSLVQPQGALLLADFYVLITDCVVRLLELIAEHVSRMRSWNPGARFLVLYNNIEDHQLEDKTTMQIYEQMLEVFYIHRITILYAIEASTYSLSSLDYFSKDACRKVISRKFGICQHGKLERTSKSLQEEMEQMQNHMDSANCTFNVCASIAAPFVENDCETGLELRIIDFIRKRLGLDVQINCSHESRGIMQYQDVWSGLLGELKLGSCDFIIGGYYPDNDVLVHFWTSDCYFDDKHTWFIKLAKERPAWMALYSIYNWQTWLCCLLMLPITWIFWYFLAKMLPEPAAHKEFSLIGINNMALIICVAINERPICYASRVFVLVLSIYGIIIVSTYTSRLIAVFANPGYLHQIDNIKEVIEAGIPFGGSKESHDWFENDEDMWIYKRYNDSILFEPNTKNLEAVKNGKRVILSNRMYIAQHNISDKVYAFPRNVFSSPVQMIMKPGFPFIYEINWLIRHMRDNGFFTKYKNDFNFNNTYLNRIAKMRPEFPESNIVITTEHLQGSFLILILGLSSSCLLFTIELCVGKNSEIKRKRMQRSKQHRRRKKFQQNSQKQEEKASKRKTRHLTYKNDKQNHKFRLIQANFGDTSQRNGELRNRFTPIHRKNVFLNDYN